MRYFIHGSVRLLISATLALSSFPIALTLDIDDSIGDHHHHHGNASKETITHELSYFSYEKHKILIYCHISLMILAWVCILPIAVMFSLTGSRRPVAIYLFTATHVVGLALGLIYNMYTPDLYPNNAHHKISWIVAAISFAYFVAHFIGSIGQPHRVNYPGNLEEAHSLVSRLRSSEANQMSIQQTGLVMLGPGRQSVSTRGTVEDGTVSRTSMSSEYGGANDASRFTGPTTPSLIGKFRSSLGRIDKWLVQARRILGYVILPVGFVAMLTGVATYGRFFEGHAIFGGLAHWIKGGVFFWLGIFSLARWAGCFSELGWAWNGRPTQGFASQWHPSAEFLETFLIFFYGSTNVFLEHIGGWGAAWTPQDLEHVSITILFIGTGLVSCGMLIESAWVQSLLNTSASHSSIEHVRITEGEAERQLPSRAGVSFNPIPALVIFILGAMMGSHHQSSMTSAMVHKQWGDMLASAAVGRALTYLILFLKRPESPYPSRPPTELIVSFCLIAGGITFMASASDVIRGMENYKLEPMFLSNAIFGLSGVIMSWELIVLALKGWSAKRSTSRRLNLA